MTINDEIKKDDKINIKKKNTLFVAFVVFSILIFVFLFPLVNNMTSNFPDAYPENEASSGTITSEIANQIAIYVWPILIIYLIFLFILIVNKTNYRKIYYPLSFFILTVIFFNLGIIYAGYMIFWLLLIIIYPLLAIMVVLAIIGSELDKKTLTKKTTFTSLGAVVLVLIIVPILIFIPKIIEFNLNRITYEREAAEREKQLKLLATKNEKVKNEIKKEFNTLIDNNCFSVNDLILTTDLSTINSIELLIIDDNLSTNETEFCNLLVESYNNIKGLLNKYNYTSQAIHFKFKNKNPYAKENSINYQENGYIIDGGSVYLIYLNPSPIYIDK